MTFGIELSIKKVYRVALFLPKMHSSARERAPVPDRKEGLKSEPRVQVGDPFPPSLLKAPDSVEVTEGARALKPGGLGLSPSFPVFFPIGPLSPGLTLFLYFYYRTV